MSGFLGRNANKGDTGATRLSGLKVQTTVLGRCIPWVFGTNRVAPNIVQWDDFQALEKREKQGGKGGGGGSSASYEYRAAVILALCRGPIVGVGSIWADKKRHTAASLGFDILTGTDTQAPHPHWATKHPDRALPYRGLAYAAKAALDLGSGGSVERHTFEVQTPSRISATNPDARVGDVLAAVLTDALDGAGLAPARLGDMTPLADFCGANGIFISPSYEDQKPAKELVERLAEIAQCGIVWSDGRLKFVPYSDTAASGNGYTYTPTIASIPTLTVDDFLPNGDGPTIRIKRRGRGEVRNHVQLKYSDRAHEYNAASVEAKDLGSIERFGVRSAEVEEYPEICVGSVAQALADFKLARALAGGATYEFRLTLRWDRLEPLDIVALTYAPDGLDAHTVRILEIEEDVEAEELMIIAEDCPLGGQLVVDSAPQPPVGGGVDYNAPPGPSATPTIFEPPLSLTGGRPEVWIATSGGAAWGGAELHVSSDGTTYQRVSETRAKARHGVLTSPLPAGAPVDTVNPLHVSVAASGAVLLSGTMQDVQDLVTACWVGGEVLAYRDATLTGPGAYRLQHLVRGAHGSDIAPHAAGEPFVRLDDAVLRYPYDRAWVGRTIAIKLPSANIHGLAQQDLSAAVAHTYTITGAALAGVTGLDWLVPWTGREARVRWDLVDGASSYEIEVQAGTPLATRRGVRGITSGEWSYTAEDAQIDGGPWRDISIRVRPVAVTGRVGPWRSVSSGNPQVGPLTGISVAEGIRQAYFQCARPADPDFAGILIWLSTTPGFAPGAATLVYDGPELFVPIGKLASGAALEAGVPYYLRCAGYDAYGRDALSISSELQIGVASAVDDIDQRIDDALANWTDFEVTAKNMLIADLTNLCPNGAGASLDGWEMFAPGSLAAEAGHGSYWAAVGVASTTALHFRGVDAAFGPRFNCKPGDAYFVRADTTPTAGGTAGQAFLLGFVWYTAAGAAGGFVAAASRPAGSSGYAEILGSVAMPPGAAAARLWVSQPGPGPIHGVGMLATRIEVRRKNGGELVVDGAITATKIAAGAVQADKIAANAVTADKIVANAITADKLAAASITAANAALGTACVETLKIKGQAVTVPAYVSTASFEAVLPAYTIPADEPGAVYSVYLMGTVTQTYSGTMRLQVDGVDVMTAQTVTGTITPMSMVVSMGPGSHAIRIASDNAANTQGCTLFVLATRR